LNVGATAVEYPSPTRPGELIAFAARIRQYRSLIVAAAVLGAIVGFAVASSRPPVFESASTLLARHATVAAPPAVASTIRALVVNQQVAANVVGELKLREGPLRLQPGALVRSHLRVDDVPGTFLVRVVVQLPDPEAAAAVANGMVREAIKLNDTLNAAAGKGVDGVLQAELTAARARLIDAEQRLVAARLSRAARSVPRPVRPEHEEARLHSEYDMASRLYEEIAVQYGKLRLQIAEKTIDLVVVEPAFPATSPSSPGRLSFAFFGGVAALTLALAAVGVLALLAPHPRST
jgi:uncharacterized protein involved in exopolysaccharide biosynthesis